MTQQIYINGQYFAKEDAKISVYDHGLLYGDGVFEGMRVYGGKVFRLEQHLIRLWESALSIALKIPITIDTLTADVNECVAKNELDEGYIRLIVTRGAGALGLTAGQSLCPSHSPYPAPAPGQTRKCSLPEVSAWIRSTIPCSSTAQSRPLSPRQGGMQRGGSARQ